MSWVVGSVPVSVRSDPDMPVREAVVSLCGRQTRLMRFGGTHRGFAKASCEGPGLVQVRFEDGQKTDCEIGYAAAGHAEDFVLTGHICRTRYQAERELFVSKSPSDERSLAVRTRYVATPVEHLETTIFVEDAVVAQSTDRLEWMVTWQGETATFCYRSGAAVIVKAQPAVETPWLKIEADCEGL